MVVSSSATSQEHDGIILSPAESPPPPMAASQTSHQQPSLNDLCTVETDIKDSLFAAIMDLRHKIQAIAERVQAVEKKAAHQQTGITKIHHTVDTHTLQLRDLQRHVEDLDNRGRRHNLRVRGLPESVSTDQIIPTVTALFNQILDKPRQTPINMERIHRSLRPRGRETDPPSDIICCLTDSKIKEEILRKARNKTQLEHEGHIVHIYQDLSAITLRHRRDLRPLLEVLNNKGIQYRCPVWAVSYISGMLRTTQDS